MSDTTKTTTHADSKSTSLTKADRDKALANGAAVTAATAPAPAQTGRIKPWEDLSADPKLQKEPREKTVLHQMLTLLRERKGAGASETEIKAKFAEIKLGHHDVRRLMTWASANRGWGFHQKKDGNFTLVEK